ncbi:MAG TPA: ATP-binding protein [Candidatus Nanopelagicales bacterium]|nr:ATP-binding protein [Candidatus Nanopelagicales bacterium]
MLTRIAITGFKAIKESGYVPLRNLTLLIGRNGSGKSSFIEALQWLQEATFAGLDAATSKRFGTFEDLLNWRSKELGLYLAFEAPSKEVRYDLIVHGAPQRPAVQKETCREGRTSGTKVTIQSRTTARGAVRSISGGNPVRDGDALALASVTKTKATGAGRLLDFIRDAVFLRLSPTAMAYRGRLRTGTRGPLLDEEGRDLVALLTRLDAAERGWVTEQVAQIIHGVEGIDVVSEGGVIGHYQTRERMRSKGGTKVFPVPSWLLSEGTRRITAIFALLAVRPRPSLIAIEEIENGLDPWTLRFVLDSLRDVSNEGVQILLTTHSPFLLDHVDPEEVLHVRRVQGDSVYEPITSFEDVVRNQGVIAPGAMYLAGYLNDTEGR